MACTEALKLPCWSTNVVGREVCDVTLMLSVRRMQVLSLYVNRSQKRSSGVFVGMKQVIPVILLS